MDYQKKRIFVFPSVPIIIFANPNLSMVAVDDDEMVNLKGIITQNLIEYDDLTSGYFTFGWIHSFVLMILLFWKDWLMGWNEI